MVAVNTSSKHVKPILNGSHLYVVARLSTISGAVVVTAIINQMVAVNTSSKPITQILNGSLLCVVAKKLSSCCDSYK